MFRWPEAILPSGPVNVAITQTLNVMLAYCFLIYGAWQIWAAASGTQPHCLSLLAGAGFWLLRAVLQPALFGRSGTSVMFTFIFTLGLALHLSAGLV